MVYNEKLKINPKEVKDKIFACWYGKNIGGTLGAPYEESTEINHVTDFETEKGKIIPNDDLDLQLVWLCAMEDKGPYNMSSEVLGEYWLSLIVHDAKEYGEAKGNMRGGLLPSMSGEYKNQKYRDSNGAWIRSEVWACMAPGFPQTAIKYAYMDACVDHGMGEGTYAALFTTAMDSIAFREKDVRKIITEALEYIPSDCRVAKSVKTVMEEYDKKTDWVKVREKLVEMDSDIGMFMAPANIGYVIMGLLYGEGDFKKSLLTAVNCGDDTDCTAATLGALLGIVNGTSGLPKDWCEHIGDKIATISVAPTYPFIPQDLDELTERVFGMIPTVLKANRIDLEFADECDWSMCKDFEKKCDVKNVICERSPYTYDGVDIIGGHVTVEYDQMPEIAPGETITGKLRLVRFAQDRRFYRVKVYAPEGWTVDISRNFRMGQGWPTNRYETQAYRDFPFSVTAGETVEDVNRIPIELTVDGRPNVFYVPLVFLGK